MGFCIIVNQITQDTCPLNRHLYEVLAFNIKNCFECFLWLGNNVLNIEKGDKFMEPFCKVFALCFIFAYYLVGACMFTCQIFSWRHVFLDVRMSNGV